jgi:conjugal transfer pilin signal peptidase TrbI
MRSHKHDLYALLALLLWVATIGASVAIQRYTDPSVVSVDVRSTIDAFTKQSAEQQLSNTQREQLAERFSQALDASLQEYQTKHRVIILVKAAVISGTKDITPQIQQSVSAKMRQVTEP